jgi:hypothetical protein
VILKGQSRSSTECTAWPHVAHVNNGREYPMEINLVLTEHPSPVFELPPPQET